MKMNYEMTTYYKINAIFVKKMKQFYVITLL